MNTPVNFEIAKLLFGKGFDKKTCFAYCERGGWNKYKMIKEPISYILKTDGNPFGEYYSGKNWNEAPTNTKNKIQCSAPTIAEVVMWLYEKHGIWIYPLPIDDDMKLWQARIIKGEPFSKLSNTLKIISNGEISYRSIYSPTEAYEAAITYVLTKLI